MTLTNWLLIIIAIPCAAVTLVALGIGWIFASNWLDGFIYRLKKRSRPM